jgi:tetratricopeptide (TPR) repeat protein
MLDTLLSGHAANPKLLLRVGVLNGAGHKLDIRGADKKAIAAFTASLSQTPDDPAANYLYGMFLAGTTKQAEAIPLLEKAKSLGIADADYTLGIVYSGIGNKDKALENLEHYAKRAPKDTNAPKLIDAIRNGRIEHKQGLPPAN